MTTAVGLIATNTLSVCDCITGTSFLIDNNADVCVFPTFPNDKCKNTPLRKPHGSQWFKNQHMEGNALLLLPLERKAISPNSTSPTCSPYTKCHFFMANNITINLQTQLVDLNNDYLLLHILSAY